MPYAYAICILLPYSRAVIPVSLCCYKVLYLHVLSCEPLRSLPKSLVFLVQSSLRSLVHSHWSKRMVVVMNCCPFTVVAKIANAASPRWTIAIVVCLVLLSTSIVFMNSFSAFLCRSTVCHRLWKTSCDFLLAVACLAWRWQERIRDISSANSFLPQRMPKTQFSPWVHLLRAPTTFSHAR